MQDYTQRQYLKLVKKGIRERIENTNSPSKLVFLFSALWDAMDAMAV